MYAKFGTQVSHISSNIAPSLQEKIRYRVEAGKIVVFLFMGNYSEHQYFNREEVTVVPERCPSVR